MIITKGEKAYMVTELESCWRVVRDVGGLQIEYKVDKALAPDAAALEAYMIENGLLV